MKYFLTIILLTLFISNKGEIEVEYHFENQCGLEINNDSISFELQNLKTMESYYSENSKVNIPNSGTYELFVTINNGKTEKSFAEIIEFTNSPTVNDTITIPRILYVSEKLNDDFQYKNVIEPKYYNCQKVCENYEVDYFKNGKIRFEGEFKNGKPIWNSEFQRNGTYIKFFYDNLGRWTKWEYYDKNGNLNEYFINIYKKNKRIRKTYNSKGKLIEKKEFPE